MGPQPVTATVWPAMGPDRTVWTTALPKWVVERAEVAGDAGVELPDVGGGDADVVGECPIGIDAEDFDELADVRLAAAALQAVSAGDVHFGGDEVADLDAGDQFADGGDRARELMAGDVGRLDARLRPLVPVVDVQVGSADRGGFDSHEDVRGGADGRYGHLRAFPFPARRRVSRVPAWWWESSVLHLLLYGL